MNKYIKMFMDDHGLKVGDEFRRKGTDAYDIWHFTENGRLENKKGMGSDIVLAKFMLGEYEVEKVKKEPWKPKKGERYYYVNNGCGYIYSHGYLDDECDRYILAHIPVFQTREEAENYKWFLDKVDEYKKPFILGKNNFFIYYDHEDKEVYKEYSDYYQRQGTIYFGNNENIEKFFKEVGEDRIKKYWFNVFEADE